MDANQVLADILSEQRKTNQLLLALIEALADEQGSDQPTVDLDGNPRPPMPEPGSHL